MTTATKEKDGVSCEMYLVRDNTREKLERLAREYAEKRIAGAAKEIAELTDCNAHGEAAETLASSLAWLYERKNRNNGFWFCNPYQLAADFLKEINETHKRLFSLPCPLFTLRYSILQAVLEMGKKDFPAETAILEKGL